MKKNRLSIIKKILISFFTALLFTAIVVSDLLYVLNQTLSDRLYQKPSPSTGEIMLLNIDQPALDELGDFGYWGRGLMGDIIFMLNEDPDNLPAVIALDVLYVGESDDPDGDEYLAEAVSCSVPVVVGSAVTFDERVAVNDDGSFYLDDSAVVAYDEPYDALKEVAYVGHINAMMDNDGVLRHGIYKLDITAEDGSVKEIPSMHSVIYDLYLEAKGNTEEKTKPYLGEKNGYYVPFTGKAGDLSDGYSVLDLLYGEIDPAEWAGKIVMIGPYAAGMQDDYATAIDHTEKMYGVEYQANMLEALIKGETKREAKAYPQYLVIFIITFLCMFFMLDRRILPATLLFVLVSMGYLLVCVLLNQKADLLIWPLYVPTFVGVLYVVTVAINYAKEAKERAKVRATFQRYVAPEIVGELLKEDSDALGLGGKTVDIAVLFVDIRGFTTMSEALPPDKVVAIINKYLTLTSECIFKNGGTLDKYVGDCTMAFWGAPLPTEDAIYKAVKAAFDMVLGAKALGEELEKEFGRSVDFGVGVNFGPAVVGNIGSTNRMDYTAIGDTVNTAARLEANAPAGTIYVSRVVADALEGRVKFTSLGDTIKLKGKADGFEILTADELIQK